MKHWKTTVSGLLAAITAAWMPFVHNEWRWEQLVFAASVATLGWFARDVDK